MDIIFLPVNKENYFQILDLKIQTEQEGFIESTEQCLKEAAELSLWHPVGIYAKETLTDTLIGFAMYGFWKEEGPHGRVWLDRFLIDKHYQGHGYGQTVLNLLIRKISAEYQCRQIYLSLYSENITAIRLYEKTGFHFNGEVDEHGEKLMVFNI